MLCTKYLVPIKCIETKIVKEYVTVLEGTDKPRHPANSGVRSENVCLLGH